MYSFRGMVVYAVEARARLCM